MNALPCNCHSLRQATRRVTQLYDRMLAPLDLRATQYSLLSEIDRLGPVAINPLADAMIMDRATLGHNLRPLEARGYVRVEVGEDDRRSRQISLTPAGCSTLARAKKLWRKAQDRSTARARLAAAVNAPEAPASVEPHGYQSYVLENKLSQVRSADVRRIENLGKVSEAGYRPGDSHHRLDGSLILGADIA